MGSFFPKFRHMFRSHEDELVSKPVCTGPECLPRPPRISECEGRYRSLALTILSVDRCIEENGTSHHTSRYEIMNRGDGKSRLVVRRGQEFFLNISLSRDYDPAYDGLSVVFTLDGIQKPRYGHGTLVLIPLLNPEDVSERSWQATIASIETNSIRIKIISPPDALVGKWKIEIDSKRKNSEDAVSFAEKEPFYIIFNPWCEDDTVYLDGEEERKEYVMNDAGLIWRGSYNRLRRTVWEYSQFEKDILDCALYMMNDVGKTRATSRNNPVIICRNLSAAVNSPDDSGAVMGNWSDDYTGGKDPTKWLGSQNILQKFYKTKKPVKYGQCWVFAGVLATVCRTLGIPCRVVTNFSSAHDTQSSLTIDCFIDAEGKELKNMRSDSVWNFHVWNEVWMKRMDLGPTICGWQAIDATPQEASDGAYRCGPASIDAVKNGEVLKPYDNQFLFAEVNADKVFWKYEGPSKPLKLVAKNTNCIGQFISTKAVGKWEREDITHTYKYAEGSDEERATMIKALRQSESLFSRYYLNEEFNDVIFKFELLDDIVIGEPFSVVLLMKNVSSEAEHCVSVILRVEAVEYTQKRDDLVKISKTDRLVKPGEVEEVHLCVTWDEYGPKLLDQGAFNMVCFATVKDTNFEYFAQDDFRVRKPDIKIKRAGDAIIGEKFEASARFTNPLPIPLTNGTFRISGPGLNEPLKIKLSENVAPGEEAFCSFAITPKFSGTATINAKFYSKELGDVDGFAHFMVKRADDESYEIPHCQ